MKLMYIDLFCGAGGTSTGVENARYNEQQCAKVVACVNHDANAIAKNLEIEITDNYGKAFQTDRQH